MYVFGTPPTIMVSAIGISMFISRLFVASADSMLRLQFTLIYILCCVWFIPVEVNSVLYSV